MIRAVLGITIAALLAGCAKMPVVAAPPPPPARTDLYILLPGADGKAGSLVVTHRDQVRILSTPHAAAKIGVPGAVEGHSPWTRDTRDPAPVTVADVRADASLGDLRARRGKIPFRWLR